MVLFFRLPFALVEFAIRQGLTGLGALLRLVRGDDDDVRVPPPAPASPREPSGNGNGAARAATPPPPSATEALRRTREREAAAPPPPPTPIRREPAAGPDHVDREATVVESFGPDLVHDLDVDEPWEGYAEMSAGKVIERLRGSDTATKAVVRMYEQQHKKRRTVIAATEK